MGISAEERKHHTRIMRRSTEQRQNRQFSCSVSPRPLGRSVFLAFTFCLPAVPSAWVSKLPIVSVDRKLLARFAPRSFRPLSQRLVVWVTVAFVVFGVFEHPE